MRNLEKTFSSFFGIFCQLNNNDILDVNIND